MSGKEPSSASPADDYASFLSDLKTAYDNADVYGDPNQPNILRLQIRDSLSTIIRVEIDADKLTDAIIERMVKAFSVSPDRAEILEQHGADNVKEFRRAYEEANPLRAEQWKIDHQRFFLRHFPRILQMAYEISITSSIMGTGLARWRQDPDSGLNEMEEVARAALEKHITDLEKLIKAIVETRTSGRPKKIEMRSMPEIVDRAYMTARRMMGGKTGEDAIPGLKQVAEALNISEAALGQQLRRAGHSWTKLKKALAKPT
jgi:hypothetical protein